MKNQNCTDNKCADSSCKTDSNCSEKKSCSIENMMCGLMCAAKEAKHELLKDKMKAQFDKKIGGKLDQVADFVTDEMIALCTEKINGETEKCEMKEGECEARKAAAVKKLSEILKG